MFGDGRKTIVLSCGLYNWKTTRFNLPFAGPDLPPGPYVSPVEERSNCKVSEIQKSKKRRVQFTKVNPHLDVVRRIERYGVFLRTYNFFEECVI